MHHIRYCKSRKEVCPAVVAYQIKLNVDLYSGIEAEPKSENIRAQ